jgi:hypothetical protein
MAIPEVDKSLTKGFAGNSGERQKREWPHKHWGIYGGPGEIRTPDLTVRSRSLYPTELRAPKIILLQGLRKSLCSASSTGMEIRLLEWPSFPKWIKNTSGFGLIVLCHLTVIWIAPPEADRLPDRLEFAISSPRLSNSALKSNLMRPPRIYKKITPLMNFTGVWPIFCAVRADVNLARSRANPTE